MTRTDALNTVRWQFMQIAADHEVRLIFALWAADHSLPETREAMDFVRERNAEALAEGLRQVEQLIDVQSGTSQPRLRC